MTDIDPIRDRAFHLAAARYSPVDEIEMVLRDAVAIEAFLRGEWRPAVAAVRGSAGEDVGPAMNEAAGWPANINAAQTEEAIQAAVNRGDYSAAVKILDANAERAASLPSDVENEFSIAAGELLREVDRAKAQRNAAEERLRYLASRWTG